MLTIEPKEEKDRGAYDWPTGYSSEARNEILGETIFLFVVFFGTLGLLFVTWKGWFLSSSLSREQGLTLTKYAYYASAGLLGGITFGMKYFYRVVARGKWHQDRRVWRIMSPFVAMTVSLIVGAMIDAKLLNAQVPTTAAMMVSIGFLAGYFADRAVGKMYEIATVFFGESKAPKSGNVE